MKQKQPKVIIIGAGISGLTAAKYLQRKGIDVTVLEAQSTIGGRITTNRSLGFAFDEGASWIHGPNGNPIASIAKSAGAKTFLTDDKNIKVYQADSKAYPIEQILEREKLFNAQVEDMSRRKNNSFAYQFYDDYPAYKNNDFWTYMLSAFTEFDTGADIRQLSSKFFDDDQAFSGEDVIITNGYDSIPKYLSKGIPIQLEQDIIRIDYLDEKIKLYTQAATFTADRVIVSIPLGVLQQGHITFTPALPKRIVKAIDGLGMGCVNKFLLVWEDAFWDTTVQYFGYTPQAKGKFNYFLNSRTYTDQNALMTFAFGDYAKVTEQMSDEEITSAIMDHLRKMFGKQIPQPKHLLRTKWKQHPYAGGSYSFVPVGSKSSLYDRFKKNIAGKIYFAGEHTHRAYRGTVHGAYLSGIRAAEDLILDLQ